MIKSNTKPEHKNCWATPQWLFDALDQEFHFDLDAAASDTNAKCTKYLTEDEDALSVDWVDDVCALTVFVNPPYDNIAPWTRKALEESNKGATVVLLVPATPDPKWWPDNVAEVRFITQGRIHFVHAETGEIVNQNNKPSALLVFRPYCNDQTVTRYVTRAELIIRGMAAANDEGVERVAV